jgi:NADH dehydrogenase FAD-containing subunit
MNEIVIIGAGYTGMAATISLAARVKGRHDIHVTLVNPQARFSERLRLHEIASGQDLADLQIPDMLAGTRVEFVRGCVTAVDAEAHTVGIDDRHTLHYATLVYALGAVADTDSVAGVDELAYTVYTAASAALLADQLARFHGGTVIVAGGGWYRIRGRHRRAAPGTGRGFTELAGARLDDGREGAHPAVRGFGAAWCAGSWRCRDR